MTLKVQFKGYNEMVKKLKEANKDVKKATNKALEVAFDTVTEKAEIAIQPHYRTGRTERSLRKKPEIQWLGDTATVRVGFDISNGGLPSIFLSRGVAPHPTAFGNPYTPKDQNLYDAFFAKRTFDEIRTKQKKIFEKELGG